GEGGVGEVGGEEAEVVGVVVGVVLPGELHEQVDHAVGARRGGGDRGRGLLVQAVPGAQQRRLQQRRLRPETLHDRGGRQAYPRGERGEGEGVGPGGADDQVRGVERRVVGDGALAWHGTASII